MTNIVKKKQKITPALIIVLILLIVLLVGTGLFLLPFSSKGPQPLTFIDAFFLSASAVSITGLVPIMNVGATLSVFGKVVLALLIQIGGLGWITIAASILTVLGVKIGINDRYLLKEALNLNTASGLIKLIKRIMIITFSIELIGFLINLIVFTKYYSVGQAIGISAFHAIASYNNSGFDIFGGTNNMQPFANDILLNLNTSFLIILGGFGTLVIYEIITIRRWKKLSIHSKIVIKVSLALIVFGTLALKLFEGSNITWLEAYFMSVSSRTAGFTSVDLMSFKNISILIMMILMFIGAGPVSTGGGIKVTTLYTMVKSIGSASLGKQTIMYNRKISESDKLKAFTLTFIAGSAVIFGAGLLMIIESGNVAHGAMNESLIFRNVLFEMVSAFSNTGLTLGMTPNLMWGSKLILSLMMLFGRVGPLTIFSIWNKNWNKPASNGVDYLEEKIIIG